MLISQVLNGKQVSPSSNKQDFSRLAYIRTGWLVWLAPCCSIWYIASLTSEWNFFPVFQTRTFSNMEFFKGIQQDWQYCAPSSLEALGWALRHTDMVLSSTTIHNSTLLRFLSRNEIYSYTFLCFLFCCCHVACNVKWLGVRKGDLELIPEQSFIPLKPRDVQIAKSLASSEILPVNCQIITQEFCVSGNCRPRWGRRFYALSCYFDRTTTRKSWLWWWRVEREQKLKHSTSMDTISWGGT